MDQEDIAVVRFWAKCVMAIFVSVIVGYFSISCLNSSYQVWSQRKAGEAELAKADSNRQIATLEAKAKMESSKHLADAEIIRSKGVAEANRIIGDSLKDNESYLRYLWIDGLSQGKNQVIYIPTEANLPILEASRNK